MRGSKSIPERHVRSVGESLSTPGASVEGQIVAVHVHEGGRHEEGMIEGRIKIREDVGIRGLHPRTRKHRIPASGGGSNCFLKGSTLNLGRIILAGVLGTNVAHAKPKLHLAHFRSKLNASADLASCD